MIFARMCKITLKRFLLGAMIVAVSPANQVCALSPQDFREWVKNHRVLVYASIAIPLFAFYARKTLKNLGSDNDNKGPGGQAKDKKAVADHVEDCLNAFVNTEKLIETCTKAFNRLVD